jgi:hypothetical protein
MLKTKLKHTYMYTFSMSLEVSEAIRIDSERTFPNLRVQQLTMAS